MDDALAQKAIDLALKGDWEKAVEVNLQIAKIAPNDTDALNRLARAYAETGAIPKAKTTAEKVLKIDSVNPIAIRSLEKWKSLKKNDKLSSTDISSDTFLEEPGTTTNAAGETVPRAGIFPILRAVQSSKAVDAVARTIQQEPGNAGSIWQMLQSILQTLMMELCMLPTPPAFVTNYESLENWGSPSRVVSSAERPICLGNYFVKPQICFGIPPACNVFFPSQIQSFAYNENFATQPTRLYFNEEVIMQLLDPRNTQQGAMPQLVRDALAVAHPEEVNAMMRQEALNPTSNWINGKNLLVYPEEFFRGPVLDRRPLPRWFFYLQEVRDPRDPAVNDPPLDTQALRAVSGDDPARAIYRLFASYEFHKEKYAKRTGGLNLVFNPYPVPGFPCAILDRRVEPLDVFGYIMSVRQNMTSSGWSTSVSYSYGRTFQEAFQLMERQFTMEGIRAQQDRDAYHQEIAAAQAAKGAVQSAGSGSSPGGK